MKVLPGIRNASKICRIALVAYLFFCFGRCVVCVAAGAAPQATGGTVPITEIRSRRIVEKNGIADTMCLMVSIMRSDLARALIAISLFSMGVGAFFGKLSFGWFFAFILGTVGFFASTSVISIIVPFSDISEGCNCKTSLIMQRDDKGNFVKTSSFLSKDCKTLDDPNQKI